MDKQIIYSKCMGCGKYRRKGTQEWTTMEPPLWHSRVAISHGYCHSCSEKIAHNIDAGLDMHHGLPVKIESIEELKNEQGR